MKKNFEEKAFECLEGTLSDDELEELARSTLESDEAFDRFVEIQEEDLLASLLFSRLAEDSEWKDLETPENIIPFYKGKSFIAILKSVSVVAIFASLSLFIINNLNQKYFKYEANLVEEKPSIDVEEITSNNNEDTLKISVEYSDEEENLIGRFKGYSDDALSIFKEEDSKVGSNYTHFIDSKKRIKIVKSEIFEYSLEEREATVPMCFSLVPFPVKLNEESMPICKESGFYFKSSIDKRENYVELITNNSNFPCEENIEKDSLFFDDIGMALKEDVDYSSKKSIINISGLEKINIPPPHASNVLFSGAFAMLLFRRRR